MTAARKIATETTPRAEPRRASTRELFQRGLDRVDVAGLVEVAKEYGDDYERELADLKAGRHPLQRPKPAR